MNENTGMPVWLERVLKDNPAVQALNQGKGDLPLSSMMEEALVIAQSYQSKKRGILVVKQSLYQAQLLYERLTAFLGEEDCALFGADESLRVEMIASSPEMTAMRVDTMSSLLEHPEQVVVTCPGALMRFLPEPEDFRNSCIHVKTGMELDMNTLKRKLISGGYRQTSHIDQPLTFASRGGIVDVYSINCENPIRIEFFDTEVDSIRFFDPSTQKTVQTIESVQIVPASDILFTQDQVQEVIEKTRKLYEKAGKEIPGSIETDLADLSAGVFENRLYPYLSMLEKSAGIWDYIEKPLVVWSDRSVVMENMKSIMQDTISYIQEMVSEGKMPERYSVYHEISSIASSCRSVNEDPFMDNIAQIQEVHLPNEPMDIRLKLINGAGKNILALDEREYERVISMCVELQIPYHLLDDDGEPVEGINLYLRDLGQGFRINTHDISVYTASELFEIRRHRGRYENKFRNAEVIHDFDELQPGDYIVHAGYGVGQYIGIETREIQGIRRDFLKVVYKGNAELLVPLEQFRLVRKFVSREGVVPKLNRLGTNEWQKTKQKIQENVEDIAERLLSLYSTRQTHIGYAFPPDNEETRRFEREFPYELTPDQKKAVEDIKSDMESNRPMDRLVCGDVGFGKTEVAIISSFKAVSAGKQVAVLCPTTILAEQHYKTFCQRYQNYPVTIRVLDRFVPAAKVKETLKDTRDGKVDILIGTHRILSKDVKFKDLGLLVVDEEQRFGVEHKERIKEMKTGVDVLTLSATPIPRTLQMSLVGIRQLSQLETPPLNRYSVQTYVVEKSENLVRSAIEKELARNGQVFYLYNNVEQIYNVARKIQDMIPKAAVGVVHGKMNRDDIEETMMRFNEHEIDVLVCTTIVENGIDVPNANTILIENAQDFGLAQIYQIKGRVGRSDRIAYAYLLIPPRRQLSEIASKRLQAIKEFAQLGSGYKIAMRDLTIRGAGDLLGSSQSGFIDTVGIDMYIEMLEEAIEAKKTGRPVVHNEPSANANIQKSGYIPDSFTTDDFDKLDLYQKVDRITDSGELELYRQEIIDQYGRLPKEVNAIFEKKEFDLLLDDPIVQNYRENAKTIEITFSSLYSQKMNGVFLFEEYTKISRNITIRYTGGSIHVMIPKGRNDLKTAARCIEKAREAIVQDEN
ncbi:MAG: transcription-repair coupling factor [Bulleidia sp.]